MTIAFGQKLKQGLADLLGGHLLQDMREHNTIAIARGHEQLRIEPFGYPEGERRLGFRIRCSLDRAEKRGADTGDRHDPRPRVDGMPELLLRQETAKDRQGKRSGLNRGVQTADPDFAKLVYVESDAPDEHLQAVLRSPEVRRIVKTLLEQHCESIGINTQDGELVVEWRTYEQDEESLPRLAEQLKPLTGEVLSLRASLPLFAGDAKAVRQYPLVKWGYRIELLLLLLGLVFGGVSAGFDLEPVDDWPVTFLLGGGLGAGALFVPLAWLFARGHPRGARHFRLLALLGLLVFPIGGLGLGIATNSLFDTSRPQAHHVVAVAEPEYCTWDKHWVAVQDWRDSRRTLNVELDNIALCDATKPGDTFVLVVREGFWGWAWISDIQLRR